MKPTATPDAEATNKHDSSARAGSALYYSLLYATPAQRDRALTTLEFIRTISTTLYDVTDPQVAEKKIHWWHEELARLAKQSARHPACIAVQDYLQTNESVKASLRVLSAAATEKYSPIQTEKELHELLIDDYSARLTLFNNALNAHAPATDAKTQTKAGSKDQPITFQPNSALGKMISQAGASSNSNSNSNDTIALALGQFIRLSSLLERVRRGYPVFSDERYDEYALNPDDLLDTTLENTNASAEKQASIKSLIMRSINETHSSFEQSLTYIAHAPTSNPTSLPVQTMCHIRHAQLKLWKKRMPDLLNESVSLTPVRKFIIAYRCKRRFKKTA